MRSLRRLGSSGGGGGMSLRGGRVSVDSADGSVKRNGCSRVPNCTRAVIVSVAWRSRDGNGVSSATRSRRRYVSLDDKLGSREERLEPGLCQRGDEKRRSADASDWPMRGAVKALRLRSNVAGAQAQGLPPLARPERETLASLRLVCCGIAGRAHGAGLGDRSRPAIEPAQG